MTKVFHAIFDGKVLLPDEEIDLEPNTRYIVTIENDDIGRAEEDNLWDLLEKLAGTIDGPEDWSEEHDHYLYGIAKSKK